jgi:hypothetical protein
MPWGNHMGWMPAPLAMVHTCLGDPNLLLLLLLLVLLQC